MLNFVIGGIIVCGVVIVVGCHIYDRRHAWPARSRRTSYDGDVIFSDLDWDD